MEIAIGVGVGGVAFSQADWPRFAPSKNVGIHGAAIGAVGSSASNLAIRLCLII
jgi:hypothetical protein